MADTSAVADFKRYADLVIAALGEPQPLPLNESEQTVQIERGVIYPMVLRNLAAVETTLVDRLIELAGSDRLASLAVVDRAEHHRPVYEGLLIYSWLQAFRLTYETLPASTFG